MASGALRSVVAQLPRARWSLAYGSGALPQAGGSESDTSRLLDLLVVVNDEEAEAWHTANLSKFPQHYSWTARRLLGPRGIAQAQRRFGAKVWFNTLVQMQLQVDGHDGKEEAKTKSESIGIKYGVIATSDLIEDLNDWTTLYLSGRLHKPVRTIDMQSVDVNTDPLWQAQQRNLRSAVAAALLQLPERLSERELYLTIAGLSYGGDVRMGLAENPNKVANIVDGNLEGFQQLYRPIMNHATLRGTLMWTGEQGTSMLAQDTCADAHRSLFECLPSNLKKRIEMQQRKSHQSHDRVGGEAGLATAEQVAAALSSIVAASSRSQTLKGLLTAGPGKSVAYGLRKLGKRFL